MTLHDLRDLYERYVPRASRHPNAIDHGGASWWATHELGHLLTVPPAWIGKPLFGMDTDVAPSDHNADRWYAYELAAMHVSRRLLNAVGRPDLFEREIEGTNYDVMHYGSRSRARQILRARRVLRLPRTRPDLEARLRRAIAAAPRDFDLNPSPAAPCPLTHGAT